MLRLPPWLLNTCARSVKCRSSLPAHHTLDSDPTKDGILANGMKLESFCMLGLLGRESATRLTKSSHASVHTVAVLPKAVPYGLHAQPPAKNLDYGFVFHTNKALRRRSQAPPRDLLLRAPLFSSLSRCRRQTALFPEARFIPPRLARFTVPSGAV